MNESTSCYELKHGLAADNNGIGCHGQFGGLRVAESPPTSVSQNQKEVIMAEGAEAGSAGQASVKVAEQQRVTYRYIDRPECNETFADSIVGVFFDGQSLRLEFGISRLDDRKPDAPLTARRYPACRLVLPPAAAIDLINKMQQIAAALTQAGLLKPVQMSQETNKAKNLS